MLTTVKKPADLVHSDAQENIRHIGEALKLLAAAADVEKVTIWLTYLDNLGRKCIRKNFEFDSISGTTVRYTPACLPAQNILSIAFCTGIAEQKLWHLPTEALSAVEQTFFCTAESQDAYLFPMVTEDEFWGLLSLENKYGSIRLDKTTLPAVTACTHMIKSMLSTLRHFTSDIQSVETDFGVLNRNCFYREITAKLAKVSKTDRYILVRWDLDNFKVYNDLFGIRAGDEALRIIGNSLGYIKSADPEHKIINGYLGADHFAFLARSADVDINAIVERTKSNLREFFPNFNFVPRFGVYIINDPQLDVSLMCDRARLALKSIKGSYNVHYAFYNEKLRALLLFEQVICSEMEGALRNGEFNVVLQPQYDLGTGKIIGSEALVRWHHPSKGTIFPNEFIPVFEKNGFISKMDLYVWEQSCRLLRKWLDEGLNPPPVSVNISRVDLYNPQLCETILALLAKYNISTDLFKLEVTESVYVENNEKINEIICNLKAHGFYIEMDDFGSGYSALNTLRDIRVDLVKLDLKFLFKQEDEERGSIIIRHIVDMCKELNITVMAEGVETQYQADFLKEIGCFLVQGYLLGRPMHSDKYEALLKISKCRLDK